ncbi:MAG TPA: class C beta-lactamase-related serine hydrolase [Flavobacteriia bacterium]|nr:class C beta-lactamase-related serine hydrolase [Flavobacteriia bacterium]
MKYLVFFITIALLACKSDDNKQLETELYFPPLDGNWQTESPTNLGWNTDNLQPVYAYLQEKGTKGFIILQEGKIVVEKYFNGHSASAIWNWNSAGKTLTSMTVGIAEQEGYLNIQDKTSDYLGLHWTSEPLEKENLITIKNQLSMTTGLNSANFTSTNPSNLTYVADAGTRWAYHNAPYTLLQKVVENATGEIFTNYFNAKIQDKIGLSGYWFIYQNFHIYKSNTRDMARFGLLILRNGKWQDETIINESYFNEMTTTSQNFNLSYGYLWWLNGNNSFMLPQSQEDYEGSMIPNAPNDMLMALGKNDQKIYVIPSKNMVIVRCGEDAGTDQLAYSSFDNILWSKLNTVF